MKHFLLAMATLLTISMGACSQNNKAKETTKMEKKTLVAFFSATGTTKGVAQMIANATGGDLYQIEPEEPYTSADLDWTNKRSRSSVEMQNLSSRPKIKGTVQHINDYDIIYLGFPIWWYTAPTIINTFIENHDFAGKTVIPFATSGSSDIDKSCKDLAKSYPNINWVKGKLLNGVSNDSLKNWV